MLDHVVLRSTCVGVLIGLLASGASHAQGYQGMLRGVVNDSAGFPVREAQVSILALGLMTRTDTSGRFMFRGLPRGAVELSVRRLGYGIRRVTAMITTVAFDSITVTMASQAVELQAVGVSAIRHPFMADFDQRRARGVGTFVTRAQIDARNTATPSDLFRTMPQVRLVRTSSGMGVRFPSNKYIRGRGAGFCVPMIWLDGQRAAGMEIDDLRATDIEAIELYRGASTTPAQFATSGATQCGAIVVWTRRG